jgi:hypothetical protein
MPLQIRLVVPQALHNATVLNKRSRHAVAQNDAEKKT